MPKNENFKDQRKMCPHNIVRKLHAKFGEAGACGCRDMMYRRKYVEKNDREIPILDTKMAIFKQSQKSNKIEFRHAVNCIRFLGTSLFEWYHIQVLQTLGKILFEAAKTGTSRSVSIAHTQPAALSWRRAAPRWIWLS